MASSARRRKLDAPFKTPVRYSPLVTRHSPLRVIRHWSLFPALLIDRFDHIGHGLEFFLAGQNAIDGLTGLALGVADREQCGVRVANHVGTGVLGLAIAAGVPGAG